jgi:hypothetical protein
MKITTSNRSCLLALFSLFCLPFALGSCGSNPKAAEPAVEDESGDVEYNRASRLPVIVGTAIEASTGSLLAGVSITGPNGEVATTDADGRFELRGLAGGNKYLIKATTEAGLKGENQLRSLTGGRLEVVIYLR